MAHTAPATTAFVLHCTRIDKDAMKNLGFNFQWRSESFCIAIFHSLIGKAAMDAPRFWNFSRCPTSIG